MNLYFYVFIGVNVLSLLLCLYTVIKSLKFYKLDNYPFSVSLYRVYSDKFVKWINGNWGNIGDKIFKISFVIIYFLFQFCRKSSSLLGLFVALFWFVTLFFAYGVISDFVILIIKTGRCIWDFFIYLKTKRVYGLYFYKFVGKGKWKSCFFTNEFKKVSFFKFVVIPFLFSDIIIFDALMYKVCGLEIPDYVEKFIFGYMFLSWILFAFSCGLYFIFKEIVSSFKKNILKIKDDLLKTVSFYPSGNVREICFFRNRYLYWVKSFFDKKNRLSLYKYFDDNWDLNFYRVYFYSGNIAFEFFKSNNSIVYYRNNPRKEVVAEAFFDEYRSLIYFVEYDFVKVSSGKNIKHEIVRKDDDFIGWKYLKLGKETSITQSMEKEEVENILQQFDLKFKKI